MALYHTSVGVDPDNVVASWVISGPQDACHIPDPVKALLALPGVTQVDVRYDHGAGEHIEVFRKMLA